MSAEVSLALAPAAPPARPRVLLVGTALASGATVMAFVALIGVYLSERSQAIAGGGTWLPDGSSIPLTPGNMAFATLLLSGLTMWWAVESVGRNDRQMAYLALGLTLFFAVAVIISIKLPVTYVVVGGLLSLSLARTSVPRPKVDLNADPFDEGE